MERLKLKPYGDMRNEVRFEHPQTPHGPVTLSHHIFPTLTFGRTVYYFCLFYFTSWYGTVRVVRCTAWYTKIKDEHIFNCRTPLTWSSNLRQSSFSDSSAFRSSQMSLTNLLCVSSSWSSRLWTEATLSTRFG